MNGTENKNNGMVHLYYGDGKGKTSILAGSALRFAGHDGRVLFTQFLKDGSSGEVCRLKEAEGVTCLAFTGLCKFTTQMTPQELAQTKADYQQFLKTLEGEIKSGAYGLVLLDEVTDACETGMISWEQLYRMITERPPHVELMLSGHVITDELLSLCDYVTECKKIAHPYDRGISAREGIEY